MSLRVAAVDLNGQFRGKRVPKSAADKTIHMPLSVMNLDIEGSDIEGSPLVFATGDQDGVLVPWGPAPVPLPWLGPDAQLRPAMMYRDPATPFDGDPRYALIAVLDRYREAGLSVVAACELEFYLLEPDGNLAPALNPQTGQRLDGTEILSLRELDGFAAFFDQIEAGAQAMGLSEITITGEAGIGQFEVTLTHTDALKAADDVVLLKELIKGVARAQGMVASFMAKPFARESGNGLHTHFSILNTQGQNVLRDQQTLEGAVAGLIARFAEASLICAPFPNSYARFVDNAHAPVSACWGHDNRTVALRIPAGPAAATRIEHRVAGGDANPYLLFALMFGAALDGIQNGATPPPAVTGNAYAQGHPRALADGLDAAIDAFGAARWDGIFAPLLVENLIATKRQEAQIFADASPTQAVWRLLERA